MHITAKFIGGAYEPSMIPTSKLPEVAFLGRSNVGKSTFINRLVNNKGLARASSRPGRTQEVNIFQVELSESNKKKREIICADLPGFGFAKVSKRKRAGLTDLIVTYLESRKNLSLICLLNDIRREPGTEEILLRDSAFESGVQLIVILTKADKLSNNDRIKAVKKISDLYGLSPGDVILSGEKISTRSVWGKILPILFQ